MTLAQRDMVIASEGIRKTKEFMANREIDYLVYLWHWIAIFGVCLVKIGKLDTDSSYPIGFSDQDTYSSCW